MFATNIEIQRIDDAGSGSPRNCFLSLSCADFEIVIEKSSWVDRQDFPVFSHVPEVFGLFWNAGSDSSTITHGNLSSSQIVFCGANGVGSSSDAIVTSTVSESLLSSKNK